MTNTTTNTKRALVLAAIVLPLMFTTTDAAPTRRLRGEVVSSMVPSLTQLEAVKPPSSFGFFESENKVRRNMWRTIQGGSHKTGE